MNVDAISTAEKFRKAAYHDAYTNGVCNHLAEHMPDNFHHGNHKIGYVAPVKGENAVILYFQNSISKENMDNLNTLNNTNPKHQNHSVISTNGKGTQFMDSNCDRQLIVNNITDKLDNINLKIVEMGSFFEEQQKNLDNHINITASQFDNSISRNTTFIEFNKLTGKKKKKIQDSEWIFGYLKDIKRQNMLRKMFNGKLPGFCIIHEYDIDVESQKTYYNLYLESLRNGCPEIGARLSLNNIYNLFITKPDDKEGVFHKIQKIDICGLNYKKMCMSSQVWIEPDNKHFNLRLPELFPFRVYRYNYDSSVGSWTKYKKYDSNFKYYNNYKCKEYVSIEMYYNSSNNSRKENQGINIVFEPDKLLINGISNTITTYIPKNVLEYGKNYFKNLRITIFINNMNFIHSNGDKWNCDLSKSLRIAVPKLFKLYQNTIEYRNQEWKYENPDYKGNIPSENISNSNKNNIEPLMNVFLRKSQSKNENSKKKKSTTVTSVTNTDTNTNVVSPTSNKKRSNDRTGCLYAVQTPELKTIGEELGIEIFKCGTWSNDESQLKNRYQAHFLSPIDLKIIARDVPLPRLTETHLWFSQSIMKNNNLKKIIKKFETNYVVPGNEFFALPYDILEKQCLLAVESMKNNLS